MSRPLKVVAFGGGTGLSSLLRGLADHGPSIEPIAIVAVSDDGGSSGRLRKSLGVPAVGDARACLSALSREEWARTLEYRFRKGPMLKGHALGNLMLAAAHEQEKSLSGAIEHVARLIGAQGRVLPSTNACPTLVATMSDGRTIEGESVLSSIVGPIERLRLWPDLIPPAPGVMEAIETADLIVLGPGSLFTSVIAAALTTGVAKAIEASKARKVLVQNLTSQRGETDDMGVADHVRAVQEHLGARSVDAVMVHQWNGTPPPQGLVSDPRALEALGVKEIPTRLATEGGRGRLHDPKRLAAELVRFVRETALNREWREAR